MTVYESPRKKFVPEILHTDSRPFAADNAADNDAVNGPERKPPQDIVAIFHAAFHPTQGNTIDWALKASEDLDLKHVEFSCLPSGLHLMERDVVYFTKDDHPGVCVFYRQQTTEEGHRGFRLSSLGILLAKSARPRPWLHVPALKALFHNMEMDVLEPTTSNWEPARAFFEERRVRRADLGGAGSWKGWSAELERDDSALDTDPTIHLPHLLRILGPSSLTLYKHVLGRRRILIYTLPPVEAACILCQVAADMCYQYQMDAEEMEGEEDEAPEPRLKGKSKEGVKVLGMVTLNDIPKLEEESRSGRGWIACTTDAIFLEKPQCYDLLIDLRTSTPNTRPTFYVTKASESANGRLPSYRMSAVRFTWSDAKLWTELDRLLQLDADERPDICCDPSSSNMNGKTRSSSSSWTDIWRVYEDVCVMCAGLWMGSWRSPPALPCTPVSARPQNWGSIRLEGDDDLTLRKTPRPYARTVGMGIKGRPTGDTTASASSRSPPGMARPSGLSVWAWAGGKTDGQGQSSYPSSSTRGKDVAMVPHVEDRNPEPRTRQVLTTLALLQTFHLNTRAMLTRLAEVLPQRPMQAQTRPDGGDAPDTVVLTPKDVMSFDLAPFSGLDARFVEWIAEEYGNGVKVVVRRSWRDLVGLVLGFG